MDYADHPLAERILYIIAFVESSFFPIPPDILMLPMMLNNPRKVWRYAFYCTVFSVLGGFLGYAIGYYLYNSIGIWLIETYGMQDAMQRFNNEFHNWGFWIIALKGLTPIPYKLVTIASGIAHFDILKFTLASIIARAIRFYMLAVIMWYFGPMAKPLIEKHMNWALLAIFVTIILGFFVIKLF